jgi:negative regulator of flagellin synthesis FlgM
MKISGSDEIAKYINETAGARAQGPSERAPTRADVPTEPKEGAIVNLSQTSKEVQMAQRAMESEPDVRLEKVQAIKDRIEKGTYEINYEKTAEKMLKAYFDEII